MQSRCIYACRLLNIFFRSLVGAVGARSSRRETVYSTLGSSDHNASFVLQCKSLYIHHDDPYTQWYVP
jgi:hypothetical protein